MEKNLVCRIGMFQKWDNLSLEEAQYHWHYVHGPVASKMNDLLRYDQTHVVRQIELDWAEEQDDFPLDGFGKLFFDSKDSQKNNDPEVIKALQRDEAYLWKYETLFPSIEKVTVPKNPEAAFIKIMGYVRRKSDISEEQFKDKWWGYHANLASNLPNIVGYTQNLVYERKWIEPTDGYTRHDKSYDELPIDGIFELYFHNLEEMKAALESPVGQDLSKYSKTFIQSINAKLSNEIRIFKLIK